MKYLMKIVYISLLSGYDSGDIAYRIAIIYSVTKDMDVPYVHDSLMEFIYKYEAKHGR